MDHAEIQKRIDAMTAPMSAKGLVKPEANVWFEANVMPYVRLSWRDLSKDRDWDRQGHSERADTMLEMLDAADAFIAALPSAEQAKLEAFMARLGEVIDIGRSQNIDVAFVNPLVETMKRLSENVLTHQAA